MCTLRNHQQYEVHISVIDILVSCPDSTFSQGKGSGNYWVILGCAESSLDLGQSNEIVPRHPNVRINQRSRPYIMQTCHQHSFKINTAESAQPRNRPTVTRPFSLWEGRVWAREYGHLYLFFGKKAGLLFQDMCCTVQDMCYTNRITLSVVMWSQNFIFKHVVSRALGHIISCL